MPICAGSSARRQRGLSLVEMMVGITVGLFVVAAAIVLVVSQLGENRRVLLETQVQQDLRATADIITRDLRRSGFHVDAVGPTVARVWLADQPTQLPQFNEVAPIDVSSPSLPSYGYTRVDQRGFRLSLSDGTVRREINNAGPQPLTDRNTMQITSFSVVEAPGSLTTRALACPHLCPDGTEACWPVLAVRDLLITIEGRAVSDVSVVRRIESRVRVRNDLIEFNAVGPSGAPGVCP